jgi:flagellar motility protein MotE (MotC chaperone)
VKQKLIYGGAFLLIFILVTVGIIYMNSVYRNIFLLDFSQKQEITKVQKQDSLKTANVLKDSSKILQVDNILPDTTLQTDSAKISEVQTKDSVIQPPVALKEEKAVVKNEPVTKPDVAQNQGGEPIIEIKTSFQNFSDTNYVKWAKKTSGLFESMDSKKAAKIIEKYSDNIARDIIYGMKKKKAAEILAELNPDTASRIARMP